MDSSSSHSIVVLRPDQSGSLTGAVDERLEGDLSGHKTSVGNALECRKVLNPGSGLPIWRGPTWC